MSGQDHQWLLRLMHSRRSVRSFRGAGLDTDILENLHKAFDLAPSAGGRHDARCRFITNTARIQELAAAARTAFAALLDGDWPQAVREALADYGGNFFWFGQAPVLAVVTCRRVPGFLASALGNTAPLFFGAEASAAMAVQNLLLTAESFKLAACCLTGPLAVREALEALLAVDSKEQLVCLVALGK